MTEQVVLEAPSIFRWKGAKQGKTMFSATAGRLVLTDRRLVFQSPQLTDDVALSSVRGCEITGRMGNLTVHAADHTGEPRSLTFGTQQLGMPMAQQWREAILALAAGAAAAAAAPVAPVPPPGAAAAGHEHPVRSVHGPAGGPSPDGHQPHPGPQPQWQPEPQWQSEPQWQPEPQPQSQSQQAAPSAPMGPDAARQRLRELDDDGARRSESAPDADLAAHLAHAHAALQALGAAQPALDALAAAYHRRSDPEALHAAGAALMDIGLPGAAVPVLVGSLALGGRRPETVTRLAVCRSRTGSDAEALATVQRHDWALHDQTCRAWAAHHAAMCGDLDQTAALIAGVDMGDAEPLRRRAVSRLARAAALGRPPTGLRDWDAILHGTVLLRESAEGPEIMHGRHAALWDSHSQLAELLTLLEWMLIRTGRRPASVVAGSDRDSAILADLVRHRWGLAGEVARGDGTTLVVRYFWTDAADPELERHLTDPGAVLFGYGLDWTTDHAIAPDVVGVEAQTLSPLWGGAVQVTDDGRGDRRSEPTAPDRRDPATIAAELAAALAGLPAYVQSDVDDLEILVGALQRGGAPLGLIGGPRDAYTRGGPVPSNQFA